MEKENMKIATCIPRQEVMDNAIFGIFMDFI